MENLTKAFEDLEDMGAYYDESNLEDLEEYNESLRKAEEALSKQGDTYEKAHEKMQNYADQQDAINEKLKEQKTALGKTEGGFKKAGKAAQSFGKSLLVSLGVMGLLLAAMALLSYGVSAFIESLHKIPDDIKIKLEIDEQVQKELDKQRLAIEKFANDYKKAWKEGDKGRIESMKEIAKKEYEMSDDRLAMILETEDGWKIAFENYLKIAEKTYEAESIMKRRIDAKTDAIIAQNKAETLFKMKSTTGGLDGKVNDGLGILGINYSMEELTKQAAKGGIGKDVYEALFVIGIPQDIIDQLRIVNDSNALLANMPEIDYEGVDFGIGKNKSKGSGSSSKYSASSKVSPLADKQAEKSGDDSKVKQLEKRLVAVRDLSYEELEIATEMARKYDVLQDDSEKRLTEHIIRVAQAREKDLNNLQQDANYELKLLEEKYARELALQNENLINTSDAHNSLNVQLDEFYKEKLRIEQEYEDNVEARGKATNDAEVAILDEKIRINRESYKTITDTITGTVEQIAKYKEEIKVIEEALAKTDEAPERIAELKEELDQLNLAIAENSAFLTDSFARNTQAMLDQANLYVIGIADAFSGLDNLTQGFMDAEDNKTKKLKNQLELSQSYREADSEQQQQMMYELELANYESKKKTFEVNKAFQIGAVIAQGAANQMDIIKAWLDPKTGGPLSPVNIAVAAAATVANLTTTIGSVAQISSTSLDQPIPPGGMGNGAGASSMGVALNPNKTALTSKEENLNMMYQSGKNGMPDTVVKVSDINQVQNKVKVRVANSTY